MKRVLISRMAAQFLSAPRFRGLLNILYFRLRMILLRGGITLREAELLRSYSAAAWFGSVLAIGSVRAKTIAALSSGAVMRSAGAKLCIYCIKPDKTSLSAGDRRTPPVNNIRLFLLTVFRNALRGISFIDIDSKIVSETWRRPLGLIIFGENCGHEKLTSDFVKWAPHLLPGGYMLFERVGGFETGLPNTIDKLIADGFYQQDDISTEVVLLRKQPIAVAPDFFVPGGRRRILVVTNALYLSGGLLRFERVGRILLQMGHEVVFCALQPEKRQHGWTGVLPVVDFEEAWRQKWDVTMLPGRAGLDEKRQRAWLGSFVEPRFGMRVQHILNDQTYSAEFLDLNKVFHPHLVIFNNYAWRPGDFTQFVANEFHMLVGGIDSEAFVVCRAHWKGSEIVIGGQARKNPEVLIACLDSLPEHYRLRLYGAASDALTKACARHIASARIELLGVLEERELPAFYSSVDVVVSTEEFRWKEL